MRISRLNALQVPMFTSVNRVNNKNDFKNPKMPVNNSFIYPVSNINFTGGELTPVEEIMQKMQSNETGISILSDIDNLSDEEKTVFIRKYCAHTGFDDLNTVNTKMRNHARKVILESADVSGVKVISAGFHNRCSANINAAFPGSDLDALSVIVDGEQGQIKRFEDSLWEKFDPSLVSIRKEFEQPDVYSLEQLAAWCDIIDEVVISSGLDKNADVYQEDLLVADDFDKALEFNIDVAKYLTPYSKEDIKAKTSLFDKKLASKYETVKTINASVSSALETLRSGRKLIEGELSSKNQETLDRIKNSYLYKYGNICIQDADLGVKDKLKARLDFISNGGFKKLSQDEKVELILKMMYQSFNSGEQKKAQREYGSQFAQMFTNGENTDDARRAALFRAIA